MTVGVYVYNGAFYMCKKYYFKCLMCVCVCVYVYLEIKMFLYIIKDEEKGFFLESGSKFT